MDVISGNPVMFTIRATGTEPLSYHWQWKPAKEGASEEWQPCSGAEGYDTATLTISSVQKSNRGSYRCVISNCVGCQLSNTAKLDRLSMPQRNILMVTSTCNKHLISLPIELIKCECSTSTVEPLYNGHHWEPKFCP